MGVIIKYQLEFPGAGLRVSNDAFAGDLLLDADIRIVMERGRIGTTFSARIHDLPLAAARGLNALLDTGEGARVHIRLGYFDGAFTQVLDGVITEVRCMAGEGGEHLLTTIEGVEAGAHLLASTEFNDGLPQDKTLGELVELMLSKAGSLGLDRQASIENVGARFTDKTLRGQNMLAVLDELATAAQADLLIRDRKVWMGRPIKDDRYQPPVFDPDVNLASFAPFASDLPRETDRNILNPAEAVRVEGFNFVVTGDPALRPAQVVSTTIEGFADRSGAEFRIRDLTHEFGSGTGYLCRGTAVRVRADENTVRRASLNRATAGAFVETLSRKIRDERRQRPVVEVAQVSEHAPGSTEGGTGHRSTLYYGQRFAREETQPSVRAEVETSQEQLLRNKPIASPFAWHRCGLVVPVYPGMKALLNHNLSLPDDAVVSGFLWSERPGIEPPQSKEGDWWICLPIDFDTTRPPAADTLAANDLTGNDGRRVIQIKGLKITVGAEALPTVGSRPEEGNEDEFLIEHQSGTKVLIDRDGVVKIEAVKGLKVTGDVSVEGRVELQGDLAISGNLDLKNGNVKIQGEVDII